MTTRTVGWALSWEYWRRGMVWVVVALSGLVVGCIAAIYAPLLMVTGLQYSQLRAEFDAGVLVLVILPPLVLAMVAAASSRRQYVLPVATRWLALNTLLNGALASACIYCSVALALRGLLDAQWPLLLPVCWTATIYMLLQALTWQVGRSRGLFSLLLAVFLVAAVSLGVAYLLPHLLPKADEPARTALSIAGELTLVLAPVGVLAYLLGVSGLARDRRGAGWTLDWLARGWHRITELLAGVSPTTKQRVFRSPNAAQLWYEWHTKGRFVLWLVSAVLAGLLVWLSFGPRGADIDGAIGGLGAMLVMLSPLVGLYLGSEGSRFDRRAFAATRPLTDRAMAAAVLKNVGIVVCSCSAVWLAGIAVALIAFRTSVTDAYWHLWAAGRLATVSVYVVPTAKLLFELSGILLGLWTAVALGAALALARSWFVAVGGCSVIVLIVGLPCVLYRTGFTVIGLSVACFVVTLIVFALASHLRLVSGRMLIACAAAYVLLCAGSIAACLLGEGWPPLAGQVAIAGFCAAPFAPLAAAPSALYWNRHR